MRARNVSFPRQQGMALAVVLILLVVLTLLALAGLRGTLLEQFMSTSQMDRALTFQAAEAALREGEARASFKPADPGVGTCAGGVCGRPASGLRRWLGCPTVAEQTAGTCTDLKWNGMSTVAITDLQGTTLAPPRYLVEVMEVDTIPGADCVTDGDVSPDAACTSRESRYRVTARAGDSTLANGRSDVILQSNLAVP